MRCVVLFRASSIESFEECVRFNPAYNTILDFLYFVGISNECLIIDCEIVRTERVIDKRCCNLPPV